jgi:hypothetical protein
MSQRTTTDVHCPRCGRFVGLIGSDGTGPLFEGCLSDDPSHPMGCPMLTRLTRYQSDAQRRVTAVASLAPSRKEQRHVHTVRARVGRAKA